MNHSGGESATLRLSGSATQSYMYHPNHGIKPECPPHAPARRDTSTAFYQTCNPALHTQFETHTVPTRDSSAHYPDVSHISTPVTSPGPLVNSSNTKFRDAFTYAVALLPTVGPCLLVVARLLTFELPVAFLRVPQRAQDSATDGLRRVERAAAAAAAAGVAATAAGVAAMAGAGVARAVVVAAAAAGAAAAADVADRKSVV